MCDGMNSSRLERYEAMTTFGFGCLARGPAGCNYIQLRLDNDDEIVLLKGFVMMKGIRDFFSWNYCTLYSIANMLFAGNAV